MAPMRGPSRSGAEKERHRNHGEESVRRAAEISGLDAIGHEWVRSEAARFPGFANCSNRGRKPLPEI
jgi:hypothetical protein